MDLDLWLGDEHVAHTTPVGRTGKVRVVYEDSVVERLGAEVPLLSCSLPTPGPGEPGKTHAFLEGLLPEGQALAAVAARVRGVRLNLGGVPETPADAVALLAEYGRECAGAVIVMPSGEAPSDRGHYEPLSDADLASLVSALPELPLGADPPAGIRMSLAGAQDKLLLARRDGRWHRPAAGAASTHILKPATAWPHSAHNEALVLGLARTVGLATHPTWVEQIGPTSVLVAERYDRRPDGTRLHQEDMCQALGMRPSTKYEIGRPSLRMATVLRDWATSYRHELERLFAQVAFRCLVGDVDGHGKNYSLLLDGGRVTLAPLYDSLCTLIYPELDGRMGAPVGAQQHIDKVDREALLVEAKAMGLQPADAEASLERLATGLRAGLADLGPTALEGWPGEQVVDLIDARLVRLLDGAPLGGRTPSRTGRARTLDAATRERKS